MMKDLVKVVKMWRDVGRIILGEFGPFLFGLITGFVLCPLLPVMLDSLRRSLFTIPWL
jgi:hypothetical protein